jgi:hypothetical protein
MVGGTPTIVQQQKKIKEASNSPRLDRILIIHFVGVVVFS